MIDSGVSGLAAVERPLVSPAAARPLQGEQHIGAALRGRKVFLVATEFMRVEHDPEWFCRRAILNADEILVLSGPGPVAAGPLCFKNQVRTGQSSGQVFGLAKNFVSPQEQYSAGLDLMRVSTRVSCREVLRLLVQPLADFPAAARDKWPIDLLQERCEFALHGLPLFVRQLAIVNGCTTEQSRAFFP